MAELLEVKRTSYRNWEENTEPSLTTIKSIANVLEIPAWKLLDGIIDFSDALGQKKSGSTEPDYTELFAQIKQYASGIINLVEAKKAPVRVVDPETKTGHLPTQRVRFSGKNKTDKKLKDK